MQGRAYPWDLGEVHPVGLNANELVHHGLVGPLQQQGRDRVLLPVQDHDDGGCLATALAKIKELALF